MLFPFGACRGRCCLCANTEDAHMQKSFKHNRKEWECVSVCVLSGEWMGNKNIFFFILMHIYCIFLFTCIICVCMSCLSVCVRVCHEAEGFLFFFQGMDGGISGWEKDGEQRIFLLKFKSCVPPSSDVIKSSRGDEF